MNRQKKPIKEKNESLKEILNNKRVIILFVLGLLAISSLVFFSDSILPSLFKYKNINTDNIVEPINQTFSSFGACLNYANVTFYGAYWCSHCTNQKIILGDNFKEIKSIECEARPGISRGELTTECISAKIEAYPTWDINGQRYTGEKTLQQLSELTGCPIQ